MAHPQHEVHRGPGAQLRGWRLRGWDLLRWEPELGQPPRLCLSAFGDLFIHRDHVSPGRICVPVQDPQRHQARRHQDRQTGEADDPDRDFHGAIYGASDYHSRMLLLRAAQQAELGDHAQLLQLPAGAGPPEPGLRGVYAQVLHVPSGGHYVRGVDLVRQDCGVLEDFLHPLLLGQQRHRGFHVQRREHGADVEVRHGQLRVLPQADAAVPGLNEWVGG